MSGTAEPMSDTIRLADAFAALDGVFDPRIVGYINDYKPQIVKVKGEFVWHLHPEMDDFFLVLEGKLTIQLRDRNVELSAGR